MTVEQLLKALDGARPDSVVTVDTGADIENVAAVVIERFFDDKGAAETVTLRIME